jgi:hypothetical protein
VLFKLPIQIIFGKKPLGPGDLWWDDGIFLCVDDIEPQGGKVKTCEFYNLDSAYNIFLIDLVSFLWG